MICCDNFSKLFGEEPDHLCASQVCSDIWLAWFWSFRKFRNCDLSKRESTHCACSSACLRSALHTRGRASDSFSRAESPPAHLVTRESLIKPSVNGSNNLAWSPLLLARELLSGWSLRLLLNVTQSLMKDGCSPAFHE